MIAIHKYQLPIEEISTIKLPKGSRIIRVCGVDGGIFIWAVVDTENELESRTFYLFKTGAQMSDNLSNLCYIGCGAIHIQQELMLYVFESREAWE